MNRTQALVFALVAAAFTNIYLPQPVLPVIAREFGLDAAGASWTVSLTVLGIALATLPFGRLSDTHALRPLILAGGGLVAAAGLVCAWSDDYGLLLAARLVQGLFIPALTTCVAVFLANSLPSHRLNVVLGAYVSATVVGGLGGRLLGGFLHPPLHWRYAFVSAAVLLALATLAAVRWLPGVNEPPHPSRSATSYRHLLVDPAILRLYAVAFGAFWVFSATFNYLPFQLAQPPISASVQLVTALYLAYLLGAAMGPLAGRLSNRLGNGATMALGAALLGLAQALLLIPRLWAVIIALLGVCAGFFATHAAATGALNRRLSGGRGRGNALYMLFYYVGGGAGIVVAGHAWRQAGWTAVLAVNALVLLVPLTVGILEDRRHRRSRPSRD